MIDIEKFSIYPVARFVRIAVEEGAHFEPPPLSSRDRRRRQHLDWERKMDITLTYCFGKFEGRDNNRSLTYKEVGEIFPGEKGPLDGQEVKKIVTRTVGQLYRNYPAMVSAQNDLDISNILRTQITKPEFMTSEDGTIRSIAEAVEAGQKYEDLTEYTSSTHLSAVRGILSRYGIIIPIPENKEHTNSLTEQFKKVGPDTDKKIIKQLLGEVDLNFIKHHRDIYDEYFVAVTKLLMDLGFHFDMKSGDLSPFLERMKHFEIPYGHNVTVIKNGPQKGEQNRYFVFRTQQEAIARDLLPDTDLAKFLHGSITQISGVRVNKIPNTVDLINTEYWKSIIALLEQLGIKTVRRGFNMEDFLDGCPFPVFRYTRTKRSKLLERYLYPVTYQEHLRDFCWNKIKPKLPEALS